MDTENRVSSLSVALEQQDLLSANSLSSSLSKHFSNYAADNYGATDGIRNDTSNRPADFDVLEKHEQFNYDVAQRLFSQISQNDQNIREVGMDALENAILSWACHQNDFEERQSPKSVHSQNNNNISNGSSIHNFSNKNNDLTSTLMQKALASLSRLHICCPFPDVRNRCDQILAKLKVSIFLLVWMYFVIIT